MIQETAPILVCPQCRHVGMEWRPHPDENAVGVVRCANCTRWYPYEAGVVDLLLGPLSYPADRQEFWHRHHDALDLENTDPDGEKASDGAADQLLQQKHFDKWATDGEQTYTTYNQSPFWLNMDRDVMDRWVAEVRPGELILDVGCGDGRASINFASTGARIVGFDVSKRLVQAAARRFRQEYPTAHCVFLAADATAFPFRDGSFDRVIVYGVLHHLPNVESGCREIARVLKPRGVYFGHENNKSLFRGVFDLLQRLWPQWIEEAGSEPLLQAGEIKGTSARYGVAVTTESCVFVPPHLINVLPSSVGSALYRVSNRLGRFLPLVRHNGGILILRGERA
jgi:ubiquinone/menaquinone biosynthesis C-methylase UbiE/uncharacterized protein YbaR (Trm112 family)